MTYDDAKTFAAKVNVRLTFDAKESEGIVALLHESTGIGFLAYDDHGHLRLLSPRELKLLQHIGQSPL